MSETRKQENEIKIKKDIMKPKITAVKKYKCNQCVCTLKNCITLQKHKNTKHGESQKELGNGQFGFVFDVRPGKEK